MEVYVYSIRWYCDIGDGGKMLTNSGVVAAENMGNAVHRLTTELYEDVEWVKIFAVEMGDCGYVDINAINGVVEEEGLVLEE